MKLLLSVLLTLLLVAAPALATQPAIWVQDITPHAPAEASVMILPDGSGPSLAEAHLLGGEPVDAGFTFRIVDDLGNPVPGYPREDLWLEAVDGNSQLCGLGVLLADDNTDANGEATFSGTLRGGGWSVGGVLMFQHGWEAHKSLNVQHPPVALRFNSPDINANGSVDLGDVPLFAQTFYGIYDYRADFLWDGQINLSDLVKLALALGAACP